MKGIRFVEKQRSSKDGVVTGLRNEHVSLLDREHPSASPEIQVWTREEVEDEEIKDQTNLCAKCGYKLLYLPKTQVFMCNSCHDVFQLETDTKLKNQSQPMGLKSNHDPNDNNNIDDLPVFMSWSPGSKGKINKQKSKITYSGEKGRIKHVKVDGFPQDIGFDSEIFDDGLDKEYY